MSGEQETKPHAVVAVCIPAGDQLATYFAYDLARMMAWTSLNCPETIDLKLIIATGSLIPRQRETLIDTALKIEGITHILFLDSDMRFPKNLLPRLLTRDVPAICASYTERSEPFRPVSFADSKDYSKRVWTRPEDTGTVRIAACGFGLLLLQTDMVRKMKKPRFLVGYLPTGEGTHMGEDIYFFMKMEAMGVPLLLDHDVTKEVRHIGRFEYSPSHALEYLAQHPELDDTPKIIRV